MEKFKIGKIYSSKKIHNYINENYIKSSFYGEFKGGCQAIHLEETNRDIWFILDKEKAFTGSDSYNYKCVFNE